MEFPSWYVTQSLDYIAKADSSGYNQREGMILYDVRYDSRPLFYRVSLSDMNIPYADPRHPFHKKAAFDLGDAGAGAMANNLKLGCDCLGHIHYLSAVLADDRGTPVPMENCVCVHEQDAGIGWKHTNYRTGRAAVVRSRELVLQSIITVSNYEYILAFIFNQAAELTYEVRATGILSTQPIDHALDHIGVPFGTVIHPGVLATHHQHIFSLRIDPILDGHNNQLVYSEAHAMPLEADLNPRPPIQRPRPLPPEQPRLQNPESALPKPHQLEAGGIQNRLPPFPAHARPPFLLPPPPRRIRRSRYLRHCAPGRRTLFGGLVYQPIPGRRGGEVVGRPGRQRGGRGYRGLGIVWDQSCATRGGFSGHAV